MTSLILAAALAAGASAAPAPASPPGVVINLSCMEALAASGNSGLAGVFSFISEKDSPAAFADLATHDGKALKKYVKKLDSDFKAAGGLTDWDHETLMSILAIYSGPLSKTLQKPSSGVLSRLNELSLAPKLTLEQVAARRKK